LISQKTFLLPILILFACSGKDKKINLVKNEWISSAPEIQYSILFFVSSDCPLCKSYMPEIQTIQDKMLVNKKWQVIIIEESENAEKFAAAHPKWNVKPDYKHQIAKLFQADVTPEVFVVDSASHILYRGAIDNYAIETGKHRAVADEHYLKDAIANIEAGITVKRNSTKAVGCYIE